MEKRQAAKKSCVCGQLTSRAAVEESARRTKSAEDNSAWRKKLS
jgi:hypothetical protein